jgi:hypothetical protein
MNAQNIRKLVEAGAPILVSLVLLVIDEIWGVKNKDR